MLIWKTAERLSGEPRAARWIFRFNSLPLALIDAVYCKGPPGVYERRVQLLTCWGNIVFWRHSWP